MTYTASANHIVHWRSRVVVIASCGLALIHGIGSLVVVLVCLENDVYVVLVVVTQPGHFGIGADSPFLCW